MFSLQSYLRMGVLMKLSPVRVSPSFFPLDEAASALHSLRDRVDEPMIQELVARIAWLARPTILPGWRWP
jgi:hypothetical protein